MQRTQPHTGKFLANLGPPRKLGTFKKASEQQTSKHVVDEINAYIAVRDNLLADTERFPTAAKLDSVRAANDFVSICLRSPNPLYQSQHLTERDAVRERRRCGAVQRRIAELRAHCSGLANLPAR